MASKVYLIFFTFIVILCLHYMGGLISVGNNDINSQAISDLTKQRTKLNEEIVALQQVVQQLRKVDISNFEYNEPNQVVAQGIPSTWQQPPQYQQQIPLVPPSPPMPLSLRQATLTSSSSSSSLPPTVSIKKQISSKTFPPETTTKQSIIIKNENGNIPVIYEGKKTPSSWRDFPCALRNFKKAQVTKTCEIDCDDSKCQKPLTVCEGYVECHGIVIKEKTRGQSLENAVAVLKSDSARSRDNSMQLLEASSWWQSKIITITIKPRHYIVNSYGGCGSKMMAGWLSQLPAMYKKSANHYHDPSPPLQLHSMGTKGIANPSMKGSKNDYRSGRFPGGSKFKEDTELVPSSGIDDYRIIFIYKDPVEALVSRYGYGHCMHIMGDCGKSEATWPKLDVYATQQVCVCV